MYDKRKIARVNNSLPIQRLSFHEVKKFNKTIIEYGNKYKKPLTRLRRKSILHQNTV
jgi:hypothetical protein